MSRIILLNLLLISNLSLAANEVHHPTPTEPKLVNQDIYPSLKKVVGQIPTAGSTELIQDYGELLYLQDTRTPAQCQDARNEVLVSLESFFGGRHRILSTEQTKTLAPIFDQIRNDADFFIQKLKVDLPRPRPFSYIKALTPCVPLEVTKAYPSGHATLATLYALILSEKFPAKKAQFHERAKQIGTHRILAGMHHRSDVLAGEKLGTRLFEEFTKDRDFLKKI